MKLLKLTLMMITIFTIWACNQNQKENKKIDIEKELAGIEDLRSQFQLAIKEKRYADLKNYGTSDIISLTPICGEWEEYKKLRANPNDLFSYDSLIMSPEETIIVSDSIAYDFGSSSVYYTNAEGNPVEIKDTFLAILKKDKKDGRWKLHREVATTNMK